jgi:radical SAM superfamily enzyme YgiQ (UPF0313 family)
LRIVLAYIGDEQPSWGRTAFHAPRHYFIMPAILYLRAVLAAETGYAVQSVYLNRSVQSSEEMERALRETRPDLVGFSCYSWNVDDSLILAAALGRDRAGPRLLLGGPEVAVVDPRRVGRLLEEHPEVDGVVLGEGEGVITPVVEALLEGRAAEPIPGAVLRLGGGLVAGPPASPVDLAQIPGIEPNAAEVPLGADTGVAVVYQTYRGCPYSCAYCSFHGGTPGIRRFPLERVERELSALFAAGVPCIHFADSVFDIKRSRAKAILSHCLEHNRETSLFCYAAFQGMDEELADLFEQTRIQVGVGLQSTDEGVLKRVGRRFSVDRFRSSLRVIGERRVNWYADVMFGLPGDDLPGFRRTIDRVLEFDPPFVMPFPLTVIPRTELAADLDGFEVVRYDDERVRAAIRPGSGMVYADIGLYRAFDLDDLGRFDDVATAIFVALQRFPETVRVLVEFGRRSVSTAGVRSAFDVLEFVGRRIKDRLDGTEIDPADPPLLDGAIREAVAALLGELGATEAVVDAAVALMRIEAGAAILLGRSGRRRRHREIAVRGSRRVTPEPECDWSSAEERLAFAVEHQLLRAPFAHDHLLRLAELGKHVEPREVQLAVVAPYDHFEVRVLQLSREEHAICEVVPAGREIAASTVFRRLSRHELGASFGAALERLVREGLLGLYRPAG